MKGRGKRGKREEKSERARGKGKKKGKKGGEGEEKEKKMEEISLNGGEGFQEASWGVGNVFKKFEEYTPLCGTRGFFSDHVSLGPPVAHSRWSTCLLDV